MSRLTNATGRPILCYVTDRKSLTPAAGESSREALLKRIEAAASADVDWIQVREKDLSGREILELTRGALAKAMKGSKKRETRVIVNDRVDVAIAAKADGVHLGENSLPAREVRRRLEKGDQNFLIGASCHSLQNCMTAQQSGANYIIFGPVFSTPSKTGYGEPQGLQLLAAVCRATTIPVLAIGGIHQENAAECIAAGAAGLAAIRIFQDLVDLPEVVRKLRVT